MKSIQSNDFREAGFVIKTHGFNGELKIQSDQDPKNNKGWVFFEIRNKPVPFFMLECKNSGENQYIIKLENIQTADDALELSHCAVLVPRKKSRDKKEFHWNDLIGFTVYSNENEVEIGQVTQYMPQGKIGFLSLVLNEKDILIPADPELICDINTDEKLIFVDLPDDYISVF